MKIVQKRANVEFVRDKNKIPLETVKRLIINQISQELFEMFDTSEMSIEKTTDAFRGHIIKYSVNYAIGIGDENPKIDLKNDGYMSLDDMINRAKGNIGALNLLTLDCDYFMKKNIKDHDLKGEHIYILWNDCCERNVSKFKRLLEAKPKVIKDLCKEYDKTGRLQPIPLVLLD